MVQKHKLVDNRIILCTKSDCTNHELLRDSVTKLFINPGKQTGRQHKQTLRPERSSGEASHTET